MQFRECVCCDGLFNARDLVYLGVFSGDYRGPRHEQVWLCADCLEIQWSITEKKFPFVLTKST